MSVEISPAASVKLDGSGNGQVSLGPPSGATWRLRLANVSTTGTANQPQCFLYRGSTSGPLEQVDSTYLGNSASSGKVAGAPFFAGQVLWAKWTGGDANATATLQVYGQQLRRGEQAPFDGTVAEGFPLNVATVFRAGNTIINSAGMFVYNAAPALGTLASTLGVETAGTDQYGNAYLTGDTSYENNGSFWSAVSVSSGVVSWYEAAGPAGPWTLEAGIGFSFNAITGGGLNFSGPAGNSMTGDLNVSGAITVTTTLTVAGTDVGAALSAIQAALSGASTSTNGLPNGTITGTSGGASAGTAHTHGGGSYSVSNGQHHHTLPTF